MLMDSPGEARRGAGPVQDGSSSLCPALPGPRSSRDPAGAFTAVPELSVLPQFKGSSRASEDSALSADGFHIKAGHCLGDVGPRQIKEELGASNREGAGQCLRAQRLLDGW